jgi:hypothetical protein
MVACMPPAPEYAVSPAILDRIESTVTKEFLEKLTYYARSKLSQKWWRGVWNGKIPGGAQAEDFASSALEAVMIGDPAKGGRKWDMEKHPDLMKFLCDVIDSKVSHLVERSENLMEREPVPAPDETVADFIDRKRDPRSLQVNAAPITADEEAANEKLFFALLDEVKDDLLLPRILECELDGIHKRSDIASKLSVEPDAVTQARKRLERRLPKFREKFAHMNPFKDQ